MHKILAHQEKFRVATIIDITEKDNEFFAILEMKPKFAHLNLPAFCSPAIYQLDASESDTRLTKWTGLHLAGLDENPAYGARIALLRGTCNGPGGVCIHQLKTAKQHKAIRATKADMAEIKKGVGTIFKVKNKSRLEERLMDRFFADDNTAARQLGVLGRTRDDIKFTDIDREEFKEGEIGALGTRDFEQEQADIDASKRINPDKPHDVFDRLKKMREGRLRMAIKLIKDEEIRRLRENIGPGENFPADSMKRSPQDAQQNFRIQTRGIASDRLKGLQEKTRRGNPKTPLIKEVPFGKEDRPKKNTIGDTLREEDETDAFLSLDFADENNPVSVPLSRSEGFSKKRLKKPSRKEFKRIIKAKKKLAALRSETNAAVNRLNVLGTRRRKKKFAFLEPTTTFANSFKKKKHPIPKIKTSRQEQPTSRFNPKTPLLKEVPFGEKSTKREADRDVVGRENISQAESFMPRRFKVILDKPTQRDRQRIIKARLEKLAIVRINKEKGIKVRDRGERQLKLFNQGNTGRFGEVGKVPLEKEIPFGNKGTLVEEQAQQRDEEDLFLDTGIKIRPKKPTQKERQKIIKAKLQKLAIVRIPRKEERESRATRINFVQKFVTKSKDTVKGQNIVPESKALEKFLNKGELINFKEPGARKIDRDVRIKGAVKIRSLKENTPQNRPPSTDEAGNLIPKTKRQNAAIKREQDRIRKKLGAKGIYCTPCTKTALKQLHAQVKNLVGMTGKDIVKKFQANKFNIPKNTGFTFIPETNELIDATASPKDAMKLRKRLGVPKGKDLFLEANTVGVSKVEDLASNLDKFKGQKLIGGFAGEKGFEFDATTSIIGGTKGDSIKRLGTTQRQGIRVGGKGDVEFFDNPNFAE